MQRIDQVESDTWLAVDSPEFAVRFGRLLTTTRRRSKRSVRVLAASSGAGFDRSALKQFERGSAPVDESIVAALCVLYAADVGQVLPVRRPVTIADRRISGPGASVEFEHDDPTSLLTAYLLLIRRMRNQRTAPAVVLRRGDILVLADHLGIGGAEVVERLSTLLNVSPTQRRTMALLFATGAIAICLTASGQDSTAGAATGDALTNPAERRLDVADSVPGLTLESEFVVAGTSAVATPLPPRSGPAAGPRVSRPPLTAHIRTPANPPVSAPATAVAPAPVALAASAAAPASAVRNAANTTENTTELTEPAPTQNVEQPAATAPTEAAAEIIVEPPSAALPDQVADVSGLSPATRLRVPGGDSSVASEGPTPNQSGCNPDPSQAVMSVAIPDIAYTCPVYAGGQAMIDAGFVTLVTDAGASPVLATRPGEPGTLWLAGHRSTHGAAFAEVPDLADGALVTVTSDDITATYRIVGRAYVEVHGDRVVDASGAATAEATWASVIRDDLGGDLAPRLVLQTCEGEHFRWMIYADLVA